MVQWVNGEILQANSYGDKEIGAGGGDRKGAEGVGSLGACGIEGSLRAGVG